MTTATIPTGALFTALDATTSEVVQLLRGMETETINTIPFKDSWTPAQVVVHITKSNKAIAQALNMNGEVLERDLASGIKNLEAIFLDYTVQYRAPDFLFPEQAVYNKDELIESFKRSVERLQDARIRQNLHEVIHLPPFGETTKLELLYFVLYHTMRHIHQLKNIQQQTILKQ